jgi:hypothetical protein
VGQPVLAVAGFEPPVAECERLRLSREGVADWWGGPPWSAADALVGLFASHRILIPGRQRVRGDPRGPGGPPHHAGLRSTA